MNEVKDPPGIITWVVAYVVEDTLAGHLQTAYNFLIQAPEKYGFELPMLVEIKEPDGTRRAMPS